MALEYPFKMLLYIAIILLIIGIIWSFRDRIIDVCLFNCDVKEKCDIDTQPSSESYFDSEQIDKYCSLCWDLNDNGNCPNDVLCYSVESQYGVNTNAQPNPNYEEFCEFSCDRNAHALFVQYNHMRQKVIIGC